MMLSFYYSKIAKWFGLNGKMQMNMEMTSLLKGVLWQGAGKSKVWGALEDLPELQSRIKTSSNCKH